MTAQYENIGKKGKAMELAAQKTPKLVVVAILYAILSLGSLYILKQEPTERKPSVDHIVANEERAVTNLRLILDAQQKYRGVDWDGDGVKSYAKFIAHLWQTVDGNANPVKTRFISKKLGFAMGETKALDGYFYMGIYYKENPSIVADSDEDRADSSANESEKNLKMDFSKEWAIVAIPAEYGRTGILKFIVTHDGEIHAKDGDTRRTPSVPKNFRRAEWIPIKGAVDIRKFHAKRKALHATLVPVKYAE